MKTVFKKTGVSDERTKATIVSRKWLISLKQNESTLFTWDETV